MSKSESQQKERLFFFTFWGIELVKFHVMTKVFNSSLRGASLNLWKGKYKTQFGDSDYKYVAKNTKRKNFHIEILFRKKKLKGI